MPFVNVKWIGPVSDEVKKTVARGITDVIEKETGKAREQIWVAFEDFKRSDWIAGGKSI